MLDSAQKGVLAGYPVVNLKATLLDGSYHPVDSSEMAFKTAASLAYKEGLKQAGPVILEPIGYLRAMCLNISWEMLLATLISVGAELWAWAKATRQDLILLKLKFQCRKCINMLLICVQ